MQGMAPVCAHAETVSAGAVNKSRVSAALQERCDLSLVQG